MQWIKVNAFVICIWYVNKLLMGGGLCPCSWMWVIIYAQIKIHHSMWLDEMTILTLSELSWLWSLSKYFSFYATIQWHLFQCIELVWTSAVKATIDEKCCRLYDSDITLHYLHKKYKWIKLLSHISPEKQCSFSIYEIQESVTGASTGLWSYLRYLHVESDKSV